MSNAVLLATYQRVFSSDHVTQNLKFLWHAGEPLALPISFYEQAVDWSEAYSERYNKKSSHSIQSNGLLLDHNWISFVQSGHIRLGLSLDGPSSLHGDVRRDRSGRGTHERVMKSIRLLQEAKIHFGVLCVLRARSLQFADEIFSFFADNRIYDVGFNIDEVEGANHTSSFGLTPNDTQYGSYRRFMLRLLALNERSGAPLRIREFHFFEPFLRKSSMGEEPSDDRTRPLAIISIDFQGNFATYCPELLGARSTRFGPFAMGNVLRNEIGEIFGHPTFRLVTEEIQAGISRCRSECSYFEFCGGGAPANIFFETDRFDSSETMYSRIHKKALVDAVLEFLGSPTYDSSLLTVNPVAASTDLLASDVLKR